MDATMRIEDVNGESSSSRSSLVGLSPAAHSTMSADDVIVVAEHGDIVLRVEHESENPTSSSKFRVSSLALVQQSKYFERLLQAGRFGEGSLVEEEHKILRERYKDMLDVPSAELPVIPVKDMGRISKVKSTAMLFTDFMYILHGKDIQALPPVANLANLVVVADRFDALNAIKSYVKRKKTIRAIDGKTTPKTDSALSEEKVRQRLLVAIMLDSPAWAEKYSARLIIKGWVGKELDISTALWWDLPLRFEEELTYRRDCILDTIQSLQTYFFGLYSSRERQCKLGYDSSAQCDSFQLGEMVRFFTRVGTLQLKGTVFDTSEPLVPYEGDLYALLDVLRQVPEYQIDRNHAHCGVRTRIVPLLDRLQERLQHVGVCLECWGQDREEYSWIEAKRPLLWKRQESNIGARGHANRHTDLRAMFTATERDWSSGGYSNLEFAKVSGNYV